MPPPPLRRALLGDSLDALLGLLTRQGQDILQAEGVQFPPRAAPIMLLLLTEDAGLSAADLAKALHQPHQLVTQRIDALLACGVITRRPDPADARRKVLQVTPAGRQQLAQLKDLLDRLEQVYAALFAEIGCDLAEAVLRAEAALRARPLQDRLRAF